MLFSNTLGVILIWIDGKPQLLSGRFYCLGTVFDGILTGRFTYRRQRIRIFGAGYWRKGKKYIKSKIEYEDGSIGEVRVVTDFLPPPEKLAFREETVKVTIALSKASVEFFKNKANKHHVSYQRMIRRLLDEYALQHST